MKVTAPAQSLCRCLVRLWFPHTMGEEDTHPREFSAQVIIAPSKTRAMNMMTDCMLRPTFTRRGRSLAWLFVQERKWELGLTMVKNHGLILPSQPCTLSPRGRRRRLGPWVQVLQ